MRAVVVAFAGRYKAAPVLREGSVVIAHDDARLNMIEGQLRPNRVTDERLIDAIGKLRRELFVPARLQGVAYLDADLPLGGGRWLMQPMVAARLLQAVAPQPTDVALVVGAGVGYEAAVLSFLVRSVVALEPDPDLARIGRAALVDHRIAAVTYVEAPLAAGHRAPARYDVILFGGAVAAVPQEIAGQLAAGGRMGVVLRRQDGVGRATLATRAGGALAQRVIFDAATPLLPGFAAEPGFVF
jgi:protein-L-isoaspartate(D-aspartate) O-methyltransferase